MLVNLGFSHFRKDEAILATIALMLLPMSTPAQEDANPGKPKMLPTLVASQKPTMMAMPLVAPVFFEDQEFPKRCGHFEGKKLISIDEMVVKIRAACEARRDPDFVIIARTDARAVEGMDAAIERGKRYAEAGADLIYVESMLGEGEMRRAAAEIPAPLQANMSEGNSKTPVVHFDKLHEMGFKLISYSGLLQRSAIKAMSTALSTLKKEGSAMSLYPEYLCNLVERSDLLGLDQFYQLEERLYGPIVDSEKSWRAELASKGSDNARKLPI